MVGEPHAQAGAAGPEPGPRLGQALTAGPAPGASVAVTTRLGLAQTLAWGSTFYLPAILGASIARDTGLSLPAFFAVFSGALLLSGVVGPAAGRLIDRRGGRPVLMGTSVLFAAGLALLSQAEGPGGLVAAWALLGLGMGSGLYEGAFAALVRLYGHEARKPITGVTLFAGFASTVCWPLSAWLELQFGWRGACLAWAALHLAVGLPLNAWLPRISAGHGPQGLPTPPAPPPQADAQAPPDASTPRPWATMLLLAWVFAATWFIATAMGTHLPALLRDMGLGAAAAVAVGALFGPAQVAGRLLEFGVLRHLHPLLSARLAACGHPLGALVLLLAGPALAPAFAVLHGLGNGILTIAKGTLPLALFGVAGYGERQGWLGMPARLAQALAPFAAGLAIERWGSAVLWGSGALGLSSLLALALLRAPPRR